jgi:solute carrier family 30 (zinc transporter), member 9
MISLVLSCSPLECLYIINRYGVSGSGAMLSEAIHSGADVLNQALLFYGLRRSSLKSDEDHPYGYGFET